MNSTQQEKPIVRRNRRLYVPGGVYFITGVVHERKPLFQEDTEVEILRQTLRNVKPLYPFTMQAYIFLPDHFSSHAPPNSASRNFSHPAFF